MAGSFVGLVSRTRSSAKRRAAEPGPIQWPSRGSRFCSASQACRAAPGTRNLNPRHIELRLLAGTVAAQRAGFADGVGALEDPVLPRGEAREDLGFHSLRP